MFDRHIIYMQHSSIISCTKTCVCLILKGQQQQRFEERASMETFAWTEWVWILILKQQQQQQQQQQEYPPIRKVF